MSVEGKLYQRDTVFIARLRAPCLGIHPRQYRGKADARQQQLALDESSEREDAAPRYDERVYPRCLFTHDTPPIRETRGC